ncbi:MAG: geranyl transferase [Gammaproteobacteria bacterium]|nr:geranyl transferase [Gammaproteobacteria bacterium]
MQEFVTRIENALEARLPSADLAPQRLHAAIRYAVLGNGKRVRPALVYASGESFGIHPQRLDTIAVAVEMIHAYSLIHDDLPAMDDDDLRRGRPTCHIKFDEATAILAGDALQVLAFEILASDESLEANAEQRLQLVRMLSHASGTFGMAGGQFFDLESTASANRISPTQLEQIHSLKTGALIEAAICMPAILNSQLDTISREHLKLFAQEIGLAFQIQDDILDEIGDTSTLGKNAGADRELGKATYPAVLGLEQAQQLRDSHYQNALEALDKLPQNSVALRKLAQFIVNRQQ